MDIAVDSLKSVWKAPRLSAEFDRLCGPCLHLVRFSAYIDLGLQRLAFHRPDSLLADGLLTCVVPLGVDLRIDNKAALFVGRNEPAARHAAVSAVPEIENLQLSVGKIKERRKSPAARYDQAITVDEQITLRRWPPERHGRVRMLQIQRAAAIVHPEHFARSGIQGVDKDALERPDTGREVNAAAIDDRTATCRPHGDQPTVADHLSGRWRCAPFPNQLTVFDIQAIQAAVVGREIHLAIPSGRGQTDWAVRIESPTFSTGVRIERCHTIVP